MSTDQLSPRATTPEWTAAKAPGLWDRLSLRTIAKTLPFLKVLDEQRGELEFVDPDPQLNVRAYIKTPQVYRRLLFGGSLAAAESYIRGEWDCSNLTNLIRVFIRNNLTADRLDGKLAWVMNWGNRLFHVLRKNTPKNSRSNIAAHYDLGEEFFRLWLDPTLSYSSAIFTREAQTLEAASLHKIDHVCQRLALSERDHLLEIGCGWGALAVRAAEQRGCRVTATTISADQYRVARQRAEQSPASSRLEIQQTDYRHLHGAFDKLVSIEMIEAVGHRYFADYFRQCGALLKPHGTFLMQAIVMPEARYPAYLKSVDFIQRYIFPGGCLPSLGALLSAAGKSSDFRLVQVEDFTADYAETVRRWKETFLAKVDALQQLGFSETFIRMWTYYLCYCEALFAERYVSLLQLEFAKPLAGRQLPNS